MIFPTTLQRCEHATTHLEIASIGNDNAELELATCLELQDPK